MPITMILSTAANAVGPVVLLILLGYLLKKAGFFSRSFLKTGNRLVFNVCLPCMLFVNVYEVDGLSSISWEIMGYCAGMLTVVFVLGFLAAALTTRIPARRGVIWQCSFWSNFAIIGMTMAATLGGAEAEAVTAVVSFAVVPMFSIMSVIALSLCAKKEGDQKTDFPGILRNIVRNPLIIAVVLGLVCLGIREVQRMVWGEPVFQLKQQGKLLYTTLTNLKAITSPFALLVLGGQFEFSAVGGLLKEIAVGTICRIVLAPLLGIGGAILLSRYLPGFSCGVNEFPALIAVFGSPVAVSSAVMAGSMGGDDQLATQLVVWTSLFSIVTIFAQVCILMGTGLLAV